MNKIRAYDRSVCIFTATLNVITFFQHCDRPSLPICFDPLRDGLRLQDSQAARHVQRDEVHLLHQYRHHHSLVCLRSTLPGELTVYCFIQGIQSVPGI